MRLKLSEGVFADVEVVLRPNRDVIVSGKVALDTSEDQEKNRKKYDKELLKISPPDILLLAIPPIGASLWLNISGGARIYASFIPPHFKELSLGFQNFNLTKPEKGAKICGVISVGMSGEAGAELYLTLTAKLRVLIAVAEGSITGSVGLKAVGEAAAKLKASWTKDTGLTLEEGELSLTAKAQFLAELSGQVGVYLDVWLAKLKLWEESLDIASVKFGPELDVGIKIPISMKNGALKFGELNEQSFTYPDLKDENEQKKLAKNAVSQDEKVKPPPPPSKEEAVAAVRRLDAGPVRYTDILFMDPDEARAKVAFNWISRDTYIMWLQHKHSSLDWSDAVAVSRARDENDFTELRSRLHHYISTSSIPDFVLENELEEFDLDHILYMQRNPDVLRILNRELKERRNADQETASLQSAPLQRSMGQRRMRATSSTGTRKNSRHSTARSSARLREFGTQRITAFDPHATS